MQEVCSAEQPSNRFVAKEHANQNTFFLVLFLSEVGISFVLKLNNNDCKIEKSF